MARRSKYKTRPDGRKETTKTYKNFGPSNYSGRPHFYGKTDDEIDAKIAAFERALLNAPDPAARKIGDLADAWWEENEKNFSLNSVGSYVSKLKDIQEEFGDLPAADLTAQMIYQWLSKRAAQGLSQKSITGRKSVLNQVLSYALAQGVIDVNPCTSVPIVKGVPAKKRRPASDPDVSKIEEHKADNLIAKMFYFMEYTGCRVGECVVLQEKDIDREHYKARIYKDIAFRGQEPVVKDTAKPKPAHGKLICTTTCWRSCQSTRTRRHTSFSRTGCREKARMKLCSGNTGNRSASLPRLTSSGTLTPASCIPQRST